MVFRHWCGECSYKTAWQGQSESELEQIRHYATHHPGVFAAGVVEWSTSGRGRGEPKGSNSGGGLGCLPVLGIVVLFLLLAASCGR